MKKLLLAFMLGAGLVHADVPVPPAATQAQVNAGTATFPYVSPATLAGAIGSPSSVVTTSNTPGIVTNPAAILSQPIAASLPVPYALYTAESFAGSNYGPVATIYDSSGNGRNFINVTGVTNMPTGIGGHPAFWSMGSGYATNYGLFSGAPGVDTNGSITVVYVNTSSTGTLLASGQSDDNLQYYPNIGQPGYDPFIAMGRLQSECDFRWSESSNSVHVVSFSRRGTNFFLLDNERCLAGNGYISDWQNFLNTCTNLGISSSNLFIWNCTQHSRPCSALMAVVRLDYPALTLAQMEVLSAQYDRYYNQQLGDVTLIGESQMFGHGGVNFNPAQSLSSYLGNQYNVEDVASGGFSSSDSTNQMWMQGVQKAGVQVDVWHQGTMNGSDAGSIATLTNNTLVAAAISHASHHFFVVCTPTDIWQDAGANWGEISNYTAWVTNNWPQWADGVVNICGDTNIGTSNCWQNLTYHANDGIGHLNDAGIQYWATNYIGPAVRSLLSGGAYSVVQNGLNSPNTPLATFQMAIASSLANIPVVVAPSNSWAANLFTATNTMPNFATAMVMSNAAAGPGAMWLMWRSNANFYFLSHTP